MPADTFEPGRRYFCREETSGERYGGMFHVDDDDMMVTLFAFDKVITDDFDDLLIARLEDNRIVSLHKNITNGPTTHFRPKRGIQSSSTQIGSNIVVVGEEPWRAGDDIRRVQFSIDHADSLLTHSPVYQAIVDAASDTMPDTSLFDLAVDGMTVKVWYPVWRSDGRTSKIGVRYGIEFDEPRTLHTYLADVQRVVRFVSAALGHRFGPSDIKISRLSHDEFLAAAARRSGYADHAVHYIWPIEKPTSRSWVGHAFAHVRDAEHLAEFIACLRTWIERDDAWNAAANIMMSALNLHGVMSGERLLNACTWLEEIPGAASEMAVSDEDIGAIASVAAAEAERLGHEGYKDRIAGVIRGQLKRESNEARFVRLHRKIAARYGDTALPVDVVPHLLKAMQYRGRIAHGHFEPADDTDYQSFAKAVYAMEGLCYLLTIEGLPMSEEGAKRAAGQQIAANYRQCIY